jgi:hypothetical protein
MDIIDVEYKEAFNRGYEIAKELNLKTPLFANQNKDGIAKNPMQLGMLQYIKENSLQIQKEYSNSTKKVVNINKGKGLYP